MKNVKELEKEKELAEEIAQAMIKQHYETSVEHRDIKLSAYDASSAPTQQAPK